MRAVADQANGGKGFLRKAAERARRAADTLRDEYRKGAEGDESPVQPIAPTAVDVVKAWMARSGDNTTETPATVGPTEPATGVTSDSTDDETTEAASQVATLLGKVNWRRVSEAARDSAASQRMRELADQVDWAAAKPVAARVASVLIAAAAAGELGGLQGTTGRYVARTIANETGLADKVAQRLDAFRNENNRPLVDYIETTSAETPPGTTGFEPHLAQLGQLDTGHDR